MGTPKNRNAIRPLSSIVVDYVVNNLAVYEKSMLESLRILPDVIKNRLLKKFTSTSYFSTNVNFINCFEAFANKSTIQINLTSVLVTDEMLDILCTCRQLRKLYLTREGSNCKITSEGIINLLSHTPKMTNLIIMKCGAVNDEVIKAISRHCPALQGLDVGGCRNISDIGLESLSDMKIKWLRISWTQITDAGIITLVEGNCGQTLTELMLDNCVKVTHVGLNKITECCPKLTILNFLNCNTDLFSTKVLTCQLPLKQLFWQIPL